MTSRCAFLLVTAALLGCASAESTPASTRTAAEIHAGRFVVERNGLSKKVTFRDAESSQSVVMKYKGMPVARGSLLNLIVDPEVYEKESHRVRYRFEHPLSAQPMTLLALSKSHRVGGVPVRSEDAAPVVYLFAGDEKEPRGTLKYDYDSRTLFSGQIEERRVEIERVSEDTALDRGMLRYFLFPYPAAGEFVVRIDGREAARFSQQRQHGFKSPYDLALEADLDPAARNDAMLAFVVFDLMKDFVHSNG